MILFLAGAALTSCSIIKLKRLRDEAWLEQHGRGTICCPSRKAVLADIKRREEKEATNQQHIHITVTDSEVPAVILDRLKGRNVSDFMLFGEKSDIHE